MMSLTICNAYRIVVGVAQLLLASQVLVLTGMKHFSGSPGRSICKNDFVKLDLFDFAETACNVLYCMMEWADR